jgi:hypothetical protein
MKTNHPVRSSNLVSQLIRSLRMRQKKMSRWAHRFDARRLNVEALEDRKVLATFVVTTTLDTPCPITPLPLLDPLVPDEFNATSLRCAIDKSNANAGHDLIKFKIPSTDPNHNGNWLRG